ncbi:cation diffusion facilitator family transporter [Asticcacaulis benevestitus]|uniref:Cation transporter n=1 Tax=Asticcacaulis benevestitus DSM 16100 = ATCC BAA-896 TaxID=1121022 RepID=V4QRS1_9CAUL|nr:cation diffusion facilitator family transporter [Asticcacaulis benevestitus]ESQ81893.1 hypothetical protein ABENE_21395 [Asticcacaulis benevestitus DSM 16100 = ATCC BAA-896]
MSNEKENVALGSIAASALMTIGKLIVGILTGSLGLISEGVHSLLDLAATIMTYFAIRIGDKPADENHPYGHGKVESVAALAETGLLFLTSGWVIFEAVKRLFKPEVKVDVTWWSIGVIVLSIGIDLWRAAELTRVAKKTNSQALAADALHFSSDALSSGVVLVGLVCVALGWAKGDAFASLGVAAFVCLAGWRLGRQTINSLIDTAPEGASDRIKAIIADVPAILHVNHVKVRPAGSVAYATIDIAVSRSLSQERLAKIRGEITKSVQAQMPEVEAMVVAHPIALDTETLHDRIMVVAANHQLSVHHITIHQSPRGLSVSLNLEVDGQLAMSEAHEIADHFERHICNEVGEEIEIETHIEPLIPSTLDGTDIGAGNLAPLQDFIETSLSRIEFVKDVHDIRARSTGKGLIVLFHCHVDPDVSVSIVHQKLDEMEVELKKQWPETWRVFGHTEPLI